MMPAYFFFKGQGSWVTPETLGVAHMPGFWATPNSHGLGISKGSKNPEAGWQFMKWLVEDSKYASFLVRMPSVSSDAAAWAKDAFNQAPNTRPQVLADGVKVALPVVDPITQHPKWPQMNKDIVRPALDKIWTGKAAPADVLKGLYTFKNETVGGLTPPLNYVKGKPTFITCWFPQQIKSGKFEFVKELAAA